VIGDEAKPPPKGGFLLLMEFLLVLRTQLSIAGMVE
jgi:hypothetical protein